MKTRLLVVDDMPKVREGMKTILDLQDDMVVVGEASDGTEAIMLAQMLAPDVVVMDAAMPGVDGITATRQIKAQSAPPEVVILTIHGDAAMRQSASEAGADAYIEKSEGIDKVIEWIHQQAASRRAIGQHPVDDRRDPSVDG